MEQKVRPQGNGIDRIHKRNTDHSRVTLLPPARIIQNRSPKQRLFGTFLPTFLPSSSAFRILLLLLHRHLHRLPRIPKLLHSLLAQRAMASVIRCRTQKGKLDDGAEGVENFLDRYLMSFGDCGEGEVFLAGFSYVDNAEWEMSIFKNNYGRMTGKLKERGYRGKRREENGDAYLQVWGILALVWVELWLRRRRRSWLRRSLALEGRRSRWCHGHHPLRKKLTLPSHSWSQCHVHPLRIRKALSSRCPASHTRI